MTVFTSPQRLIWGELDVPLFGLAKDLDGILLQEPATFSLVVDAQHLWFIASHRKSARLRLDTQPVLRHSVRHHSHQMEEIF